MLIFYTDKPDK